MWNGLTLPQKHMMLPIDVHAIALLAVLAVALLLLAGLL
jgi:hypothetical protein